MSRIMMRVREETRPLRMGPVGSEAVPLVASSGSAWRGPLFETHRLRSVEGVGESGPVDGAIGLMLVVRG